MRLLLPLLSVSLSACATTMPGFGPDFATGIPPGRERAPAPVPASTPDIAPVWDTARLEAILARTQRTHLAPDLSALTAGERAAAAELLAAGERLHRLYLQQRHPEALAALAYIEANPSHTLEHDVFWLNNGPIASTLDNRREAFLSVAPEDAARGVYPAGVARAELDAFFEAHPDRREDLLDNRTVVWTATAENRARAIATLDRYSVLDTLHPGLRDQLIASADYLAVPYSVAFADDILFVYERLMAAAAHVESGDAAFARYLRLRARDLLVDDYEAGDAAWVRGDFSGNLNAQIGAYESYDDALYGVKTFFSLSLLVRDRARSLALDAALTDLQAVENALPYRHHRTIDNDIPVGVYNVIADFGEARGLNAATILPNEPHLTRQYGRLILMRGNILLNDDVFHDMHARYAAAVAPSQADDFEPEGRFHFALYHEIGHYLGVTETDAGGDMRAMLEENGEVFEEMKADLVSLTAARVLHERGRLSDAQVRGFYAAGVRRLFLVNPPNPEHVYQRMLLIQLNWFIDQGALRFENDRFRIDYERYPIAVSSLLREVLAIQRAGDPAAARAFAARWTAWRTEMHGVVAERLRAIESTRFNLVTYEALDDRRWLAEAPEATEVEPAQPLPLRGFLSR